MNEHLEIKITPRDININDLSQVKNALKEQPEGSTLPRVIEREPWNNEKFGAGLDHLRLAKSVSDIIQNIQRNKRKGSPH